MNQLFAIVPLLFFICHLCSATLFNAADNYAINCGGSSASSAATDGRKWIGDVRSRHSTFSIESKGKLMISKSGVDSLSSIDPIPYATAQVSRSDFTYTFKVNPGPKFIRLHFRPSSYASFKRSTSMFTVKAGNYTLLNNFSPSITADALNLKAFTKEFCINVRENQPLKITFSPSATDNAFAFINGIEVVSMPANLYYSNRLPIDETIALEATHRLNIGGKSIPAAEDTGMFREWLNDSSYLNIDGKSSVSAVATTLRIRYRKVPSYIAPQKIYQTSWSTDSYLQVEKKYSFTWKLAVDTGFRYLVRLHFCELDYEMKEIGQKGFSISIDNQTVEEEGDLIKWGGEIGFAFYRDYMFVVDGDIMEGKRDVFISIHPHLNNDLVMVDAILKGMEVLKLSNPDNNLAGVNPNAPPTYDSKSFGFQEILLISLVVILFAVSYIYLQRNKVEIGSRNIVVRGSDNLCRKLSHNFSAVRSDKFGKVYKGNMDNGTPVEVRQLMYMQEEADGFETSIKISPKLKHEHLIDLIGYCRKGQEIILVYEHMEKGTFADHIFKSDCRLSWVERLRVCHSAALGIAYLHTKDTIHRDINSSSILLNKNFTPKISDFQLSGKKTTSNDASTTHISKDVKGTIGYLDPDYFSTKTLSKKSDVYSFGVVMWEALSGRPVFEVGIKNKKNKKNERNLAIWAQQCYKEGKIDQIIDTAIKPSISSPSLDVFTAIANKCVHNDPTKRLSMAQVAEFLRTALEFQSRSVDKTEVDAVIDSVGIDTNQYVLSDQQREAFQNRLLNSNCVGPYTLELLFIVLEDCKTYADVFDKKTLTKVGRRVRETLDKFKEDMLAKKFEEDIKLAKKNKNKERTPVEIHSLTLDVMEFMEQLLFHIETINSLTNNDIKFDHYFQSLISALKSKLEETAQSYKQTYRQKFLNDNRDFMVRKVTEGVSFARVMKVESVWSIFLKGEPRWNSLNSICKALWQ
ncbi:receptor-like protein kinase FERONIA [Impatiens glandulifera]|uniref:receptor-like protein kinase FERONIA n=1 Tax=Impatiens glandulifera TaxID=253017 RepID=UPI001FB0856F|nr:receptor-like protein kinase FERONIA [Impatiens glandulifera]